jgi:cell division protein FtsL
MCFSFLKKSLCTFITTYAIISSRIIYELYVTVIVTGKICSTETQIRIVNVSKNQQYNQSKLDFTSP